MGNLLGVCPNKQIRLLQDKLVQDENLTDWQVRQMQTLGMFRFKVIPDSQQGRTQEAAAFSEMSSPQLSVQNDKSFQSTTVLIHPRGHN